MTMAEKVRQVMIVSEKVKKKKKEEMKFWEIFLVEGKHKLL